MLRKEGPLLASTQEPTPTAAAATAASAAAVTQLFDVDGPSPRDPPRAAWAKARLNGSVGESDLLDMVQRP